jgi:hypothetical protein
LGETSRQGACMMGANFSLVTINDKFTPRIVENVVHYGLKNRLAAVPYQEVILTTHGQWDDVQALDRVAELLRPDGRPVDVHYREVGSEGNEEIEVELYLANHSGRQFNSSGGDDIAVQRRPWQTISELMIPGVSGGVEVPFNLSGAAASRVAGSSSFVRVVIQPFQSWDGSPASDTGTGRFLRLTGMMMGTL